MSNTVVRNGKTFVRQAKFPIEPRPLEEVTAIYKPGRLLDYKKLLDNICPRCCKDIMQGMNAVPAKTGRDTVITHPCGFRITERDYSKVVSGVITAQLEEKLQQDQEDLL